MEAPEALAEWTQTVREHLPNLSKPQAVVLALWSFGIVMVGTCGLTRVAVSLAPLMGSREGAIRQRLREWYWDKEDKKGEKRRELDVSGCFAPLVRWVLGWWPDTGRRIALAMDATTLSDRFSVLAISIVYRGCAIPVAWQVLAAKGRTGWKPHWLALFEHLKASIPEDWFVLVTADRGLYAPWLFDAIVKIGWHPFLRINSKDHEYRLKRHRKYRKLSEVVTQPGESWQGKVTCFKTHPLACTLLATWEARCSEPWLIVTDLDPEDAQVCWYSLCLWIECGFKHTKRGGWQWQRTRITDPTRATRFWLALAVATLWVVSVGGEADATLPPSTLEALPETHVARRRATRRTPPTLLSCFRRGISTIMSTLFLAKPLALGGFRPEPWPSSVGATGPP